MDPKRVNLELQNMLQFSTCVRNPVSAIANYLMMRLSLALHGKKNPNVIMWILT